MWVRCIFRLAKCDRNFASFFIKNSSNFISNRNDDFSENFLLRFCTAKIGDFRYFFLFVFNNGVGMFTKMSQRRAIKNAAIT